MLVLLSLGLLCGTIGLAVGQDAGKGGKKDEKKDEKKDDAPKDAPKEEKPYTQKEFDDLMEKDVRDNWNKLKFNHRKKMAEQAAASADGIAEAAPKILRYDGEVLKGDNKGKKARDQKDYQQWVADLKQHAEDYAKHVRKGDWDKAGTSRDKINETCGACHDVYESK